MNKADFVAALSRKPVSFSAGPLSVHLLPWSTKERAEFYEWKNDHPGAIVGLYERLAVISVCDEAGALLFTEADVPTLSSLDGATLEIIAKRIVELNGLDGDSPKASSTATTN